jgi:hypothetical protein
MASIGAFRAISATKTHEAFRDNAKLNIVAQEAKAKVSNNPRWIAAIEKAADAIINGKWIVTELAHVIAVTTESGQTYFTNGECQCEAYQRGQACTHRAGARLIALYREASATPPRIIRSVESERTGVKFEVVRCDGWAI